MAKRGRKPAAATAAAAPSIQESSPKNRKATTTKSLRSGGDVAKESPAKSKSTTSKSKKTENLKATISKSNNKAAAATSSSSSKKNASVLSRSKEETSAKKPAKSKKECEFDFDDEDDFVEEKPIEKKTTKGRRAKNVEPKPKKTPVKQTPKNKMEKLKIEIKTTNNKKAKESKKSEEDTKVKSKKGGKKATKETNVNNNSNSKAGRKKKVKIEPERVIVQPPLAEDEDTEEEEEEVWADALAEEDSPKKEPDLKEAISTATKILDSYLEDEDEDSHQNDAGVMPFFRHHRNDSMSSTPSSMASSSSSSFAQNLLTGSVVHPSVSHSSEGQHRHQGEFQKRLSSSSLSFEASSLEKLQQETMLPKPFNINNQDAYLASALPPPIPPPMYSSNAGGLINNTPTTHSGAFPPAVYNPKAPMLRPSLDMGLAHAASPSTADGIMTPLIPPSPLGPPHPSHHALPPHPHPHSHLPRTEQHMNTDLNMMRPQVPPAAVAHPQHHQHPSSSNLLPHQAAPHNHQQPSVAAAPPPGSLQQQQQQPPPSNDPTHGVPPDLVAKGWRKFWSRREGRYYYYNKITQQSEWDLPKLMGGSSMSDPLGIQSASHPPPPSMPQHYGPPMPMTPTDPNAPGAYHHHPHQQQQQQPHPHHPGTPNAADSQVNAYPILSPHMPPQLVNTNSNNSNANGEKRYIGPYDFEIDPNCSYYEGPVFSYFHAHPDTEALRAEQVSKIRNTYFDMCRARQSIDSPKDSFSRWLMERQVTDRGWDTLLASDCSAEMSRMLYNEIMRDIPVKLVKSEYCGQARKQLSKYAESAKKIITAPHVSQNSRKIVIWNVEEAFEWIRRTTNATLEDYVERLEHLKKQCQGHINDAAKQAIEGICIKIYQLSIDSSRRVRELNAEIFKKEGLQERMKPNFPRQMTPCYPAYLINPCPKLPAVQFYSDPVKDAVFLRYKVSELLKINRSYWTKLEGLYHFGCRDDYQKYNLFLQRAWCLLKRYQALFTQSDGCSLQDSLPLSVFIALNKHFGVTVECFSSPLNCFFRQYCSLFPDTDGYFGSVGPILNFYPCSGSFQAFPPDCEDLIDTSLTHFEKLLESTTDPLSFAIFIQEWPDTSERILHRLESNRFKREHLKIAANEYELRHGVQYMFPVTDPNIYHKSPLNMMIFFLQNDAGFLKWGPTPERLEQLTEAFQIGRDRDLPMRSPPPTPTGNIKMDGSESRQHNPEGDPKETS